MTDNTELPPTIIIGNKCDLPTADDQSKGNNLPTAEDQSKGK